MLGCDSNKEYDHRFVYLQALMTLCVDRRNDHIVWDTKEDTVSLWQGNDLIQYFYCELDEPFDIHRAEHALYTFLDQNSMVYDRRRSVVRDTHHEPAKRVHNSDSMEQVLKREQEWSLTVGTRQYALCVNTSKMECDSGRRSSSRIQLLDEKAEEERRRREKEELQLRNAEEKRKKNEEKARMKMTKEIEKKKKKEAEKLEKFRKVKSVRKLDSPIKEPAKRPVSTRILPAVKDVAVVEVNDAPKNATEFLAELLVKVFQATFCCYVNVLMLYI